MKLKLVLLVMVAVSAGVQAQEARPRESSNDQAQSVINDDRGRAYIISGETQQPLSTPGNRDSVMVQPQQNSIFLGSSWETASLRAREPELANLLAHLSDQAQLSALNERGLKNFFAATSSQEKSDGGGDRTISDLEIQSLLTGMLKEGSLQRPDASAIYVVFLDPELHSTLGTMIAGKHYAAYHNFFNASGMKIHYVVVPFEANQKTAYQIALRAFLAAALNPNGS